MPANADSKRGNPLIGRIKSRFDRRTEPCRASTNPNFLDFLLSGHSSPQWIDIPRYLESTWETPEGVTLFQIRTRGSPVDQPANHDVEGNDYPVFVVPGGAVLDPVRKVTDLLNDQLHFRFLPGTPNRLNASNDSKAVGGTTRSISLLLSVRAD